MEIQIRKKLNSQGFLKLLPGDLVRKDLPLWYLLIMRRSLANNASLERPWNVHCMVHTEYFVSSAQPLLS